MLACAFPLVTGCWGGKSDHDHGDKAAAPISPSKTEAPKSEFVSLFDGKTLDGWKINESPETFKVEDGNLVVNGNRGHAFYDGPVANHDFKNFHFKADVMTMPNSNSGIYFHTAFQPDG